MKIANKTLTCLLVDKPSTSNNEIVHTLKEGKFRRVFLEENIYRAKSIVKYHEIDLIIFNMGIKRNSVIDFHQKLKNMKYKGKILYMSEHESELHLELAYKSGADGYFYRQQYRLILNKIVDSLLNGYSYFKIRKTISPDQPNKKCPTLSSQELKVLSYLLDGISNNEIANIMSISPKTVSTYKTRILNKYNVNTILDVMKFHNNS